MITKDPEIIISDSDNNIFINWDFDVPLSQFSTSGWITELYKNQSIILSNDKPILNITDWWEFNDKITGDFEFFNIIKDFRHSYDGYVYSDWKLLTIENLELLGANRKIWFHIRYSAIEVNENYNINIPIKKPDNNGWFKLYSVNDYYQIEKNYPTRGTLKYTIGWGTNGEYHVDTNTSKIYVKNNGIWTGGVYFQGTSSNYLPSKFNNQTLSDAFINNINSKFGFIPNNDYVLTNDIKFGELIGSANSIPLKNDFIFINPLFQGIVLKGKENLKIEYTPIILPESYEKRVYIKNIEIFAKQWIDIMSENSLFCLTEYGEQKIFKPPFLLKLYSVDSFSVEVDGKCSTSWNPCLDIKFRYSWNSRKWDTEWMPLTLANLKCIKPNPLNFFYIEFLFTKICDDNGKPICISDIVINGNIQNVSKDYDKINRFGLRSDIDYGIIEDLPCIDDSCNKSKSSIIPHEWITDNDVCVNPPTFNPYDSTKVLAYNEKLANDMSQMFGWDIIYYKTSANEAGVDKVLHEYGTYDTLDKKTVKILVPDNKFPDDEIVFNMFEMALFNSFEIHITKKEFYSKFGLGSRPAQKDFMFIPQINKYYEVEHAQSFRDFMNSAIYFKLTLGKKKDDTNIDNRTYTSDFNSLIENNQLDNLFHKEVKEDIKKVINDPLLQNLTEINAIDTKLTYDDNVEILLNKGVDKKEVVDYKKPDPIMNKIMIKSIENDLENGTTVISRNYYDLSSKINDVAVIYGNIDNEICDCCNRSYVAWFMIPKYVAGMRYNFIDNSNSITNEGYKIDFIDGNFEIYYGSQIYDIDVSVAVNGWYGVLINFNQKQHKLEFYLYKRKGNCLTNELELVDHQDFVLNPISINDDELIMKILGSNMHIRNIRIFEEIIPQSQHSFVLSQYIVKNTEYMILGDNMNKIVITNHRKY